MQRGNGRRVDKTTQRQTVAAMLLRERALATPMQQVRARRVRAGEQRVVAAAPRRIEGGAVVDLGLTELVLPPAGHAQPVIDRAEHMQRQVRHGDRLQQPLDHVPLADRAERVEQRAGRQQRGGRALVVGACEVDRVARQFEVFDAAGEHAGQRRRVAQLGPAHMPVQPTDHGLLVDADLLGQPPLLQPEFGDAVAQPRAVQRDGGGVDRWKKLRHHRV